MSEGDDLVRTSAPTFDTAHFRAVLGHFASGIVIVTGMDGDEPVGLTCQSFFSVSLEPPMIAFAPSRSSKSWPRIEGSGAFCVNVLTADQEEVCRLFAQSGADKFKGVGWKAASSGSPLLSDCLAWIDCRIEAVHDAGDHLIVIGMVGEMGHTSSHPARPLLFFRGGYGTFEA